MSKPVLNIADVELMDFGSPKSKFKAKPGRMGPVLGARKLGAMLTILEPGKRAFPFHRHHAIEEMFNIVEGSGECRYGSETHAIKPGDLHGGWRGCRRISGQRQVPRLCGRQRRREGCQFLRGRGVKRFPGPQSSFFRYSAAVVASTNVSVCSAMS
jgi:Cupin domain